MAFNQGGQWFAEFIANGDLLLSSTVDWQVKRTFHGVQRFSFGKDDKWMVIVTKDKAAEAWNLSSNDPPVTIAGAEQVDVVLANQHADIVFFGSSDVEEAQMHIWPYAGEMQPLNEEFTWTDPVVISDDGTVAVVHHNNDSDAEDDYDIVVRIAGSKVLTALSNPSANPCAPQCRRHPVDRSCDGISVPGKHLRAQGAIRSVRVRVEESTLGRKERLSPHRGCTGGQGHRVYGDPEPLSPGSRAARAPAPYSTESGDFAPVLGR